MVTIEYLEKMTFEFILYQHFIGIRLDMQSYNKFVFLHRLLLIAVSRFISFKHNMHHASCDSVLYNIYMNIALRRFLRNYGNIATKGSPKPELCPYSYFE